MACNSDSEKLAGLQTVEAVVPTKRNRLDADEFPMCQVVGPGKNFVAIWTPA